MIIVAVQHKYVYSINFVFTMSSSYLHPHNYVRASSKEIWNQQEKYTEHNEQLSALEFRLENIVISTLLLKRNK